MKRRPRTCLILLLIAAGVNAARAQEIRVNISRSEHSILRRMVVVKTSGERITNLVRIASYDQQKGVFVMESVTGETVSIALPELKRIDFEQTVDRQNAAAQEPAWEMTATPGSGLRYSVSKGLLRVDAGDMVVPAGSASSAVPGPAKTSSPASSSWKGIVSNHDVLEARSLTVDISGGVFIVEVQNVTYAEKTAGGGEGTRPSGVVK